MAPRSDRFKAFYAVLADEGLPRALGVLNQKVPHRYTAVYRLEKDTLHNHLMFDKSGEVGPENLASVPLGESFCQFVFMEGSFSTSNSAKDGRLDGNPYQGIVVSYTGVPITEHFGGGEIIGSLCHLDFFPREITNAEFELLQQAARVIHPSMIRG